MNLVRTRIEQAEKSAGRAPGSVVLIAVSKTKPAHCVTAAALAGVTDFGENYLQEAVDKMGQVNRSDLTWHFIGQLQSNKTRLAAEAFDWVHTVDRLKIAERLSQQRPFHAPPLNVCIQVKLVEEPGKGGIEPDDLVPLAEKIAALPRLKLRGLMCVPPPTADRALQRVRFAQIADLQLAVNDRGLALDTLSMGMSDDFDAAIEAGATHVRIGTAVFGER